MFGDYSIGDLGSIFVMQGFAGLILFSVDVLMALVLAIIFGQMGVINMAHGEFMILGAYVTWMTSNLFQSHLARPVQRLFLPRDDTGLPGLRALGMLVEWGADTPSLQASARYAARYLGPSLILQRRYRSVFGAPRSRCRTAVGGFIKNNDFRRRRARHRSVDCALPVRPDRRQGRRARRSPGRRPPRCRSIEGEPLGLQRLSPSKMAAASSPIISRWRRNRSGTSRASTRRRAISPA